MTNGKQELTGTLAPIDHAAPTGAAAGAEGRKPRVLDRMLALEDFEEAARRYLPRPIFGYISGGVENNVSLRSNRAVFDEIAFVPRMLVDTSARTHQDDALRAHLRRAVRHRADGRHAPWPPTRATSCSPASRRKPTCR